VKLIIARAEQLGQGDVRTDGNWMAGFHFNSALFRAAAANHRCLQLVTGMTVGIQKLCKEAKKQHEGWTGTIWVNTNIHKAHDEVDVIKHAPAGTYAARDVSYEDLVNGIDELLRLIEGWASTRRPAGSPGP